MGKKKQKVLYDADGAKEISKNRGVKLKTIQTQILRSKKMLQKKLEKRHE